MPIATPPSEFELVTVRFGARSLRSRVCGEVFHPVIGPEEEAHALHVNQQRLAQRAAALPEFIVWDVGLGAAANAIASLEALHASPSKVEIHSFERDLGALHFALAAAAELPYLHARAGAALELLDSGETRVGSVRWVLHQGDFRELPPSAASTPHAVLYDPYSPYANPEMWSLEAFAELHARLSPERPCLLTNYTRSTAVRAALLLAGFFVGLGASIAEKDQTTAASNDLALLENPLTPDWLNRARRSTRSAPPRDESPEGGPISEADLAALERHPQFYTT